MILTIPAYSKEHCCANKIYKIQGRINGEEGIPKNKHLVKGKFARKQESDPAARK
jgi:hypothetical protein